MSGWSRSRRSESLTSKANKLLLCSETTSVDRNFESFKRCTDNNHLRLILSLTLAILLSFSSRLSDQLLVMDLVVHPHPELEWEVQSTIATIKDHLTLVNMGGLPLLQ